MKEEILYLLKSSGDDFISGQKISNYLGVTRTAIWKYINQIKEDGYEIESVSRKGYRIVTSPDILTQEELRDIIDTNCIGKKIVHFNTLDSTNIKGKELATNGEEDGTVVIAEEQIAGKGRLGRKWISPKGKGIWMSIILRPDIEPIKVCMVTQVAAAAAVKAVCDEGIDAYIKWPNDIVVNNKKICGILTEMSGELDKINHVIMGMGINANIDEDEFPEDIRDIATSLKAELGRKVDRKLLTSRILNNFEDLYYEFVNNDNIKKSIDICRERSVLIGKNIQVIGRNKTTKAKALDLDEEGRLVVEYGDGKIEPLISGEVSVRGMYGYVD